MVILLTFAGLPSQIKLNAILSFLSLNVLGPSCCCVVYLFIYLFLLLISYAREKFCLLHWACLQWNGLVENQLPIEKLAWIFFLKRAWIFACGFKLNRKNIVLYFNLLMSCARKNPVCFTRLHFSGILYVFILKRNNFNNLSFFIFFSQFLWRSLLSLPNNLLTMNTACK